MAEKGSNSKIPLVQVDNIPISQILSIIPKFSERTKNLNTFINNCKTAYDLALGNQKLLILPYAIAQLEGKASAFANGKTFDSMNTFLRSLKDNFTQSKNISELLLEMQQTRQSGSMQDYVDKISSLRDELLANAVIMNDTSGQLAVEYDKLILNSFIVGLEPTYYNRIRILKPKDSVECFKYALEEDRATKFFYSHNKNIRNTSSTQRNLNNNYNNNNNKKYPVNNQRNYSDKQTRFCSHCKMNGHTIDYCRKRDKNKSSKPSTSNDRINNINNLNENEEIVPEQSVSEVESLINLLELEA